jgi:hypothetical protein
MNDGSHDVDSGMSVLDDAGEEVGTVATVEGDTAYVDLDPGLTDEVKSSLGFGDTDEDTYALRDEMVDTVDDDGVHLHGEH